MTLLWDVQAAVKALLDTALDVPVYDAADLVGADALAFVTVGEAAENGETASAEQVPSNLGNDWYDETGELPCSVTVWTGDTDVAATRTTAKTLLAACAAAVRADRSLGGLLANPGRADVSRVGLQEGQTDRGFAVDVRFTVTYSALLTS